MPLMRDVIRGLLRLQSKDSVREFLIRYYSQTPEGRSEFENSPQRDRSIESVVDDILADVESEVS